jgi:hypothetical protein
METLTELSKIFISTIANYNSNTYRWQIAFYLIGLIITILIYKKPSDRMKKIMKLYLAVCNLWISVVFFICYGSSEFHKEITAAYFGLLSLIFLIDIFTGKIVLQRNKNYDKPVFALYFLFLLYPVIGLLLGRRFPEISMWLMPCPLTVYTITLLTSFLSIKNRWIYILLLLWALPGLPKSFLFNIQEDLILGIAGVVGIIVLILEHKNENQKSLNIRKDA